MVAASLKSTTDTIDSLTDVLLGQAGATAQPLVSTADVTPVQVEIEAGSNPGMHRSFFWLVVSKSAFASHSNYHHHATSRPRQCGTGSRGDGGG
jgi:hypothetical protein